MQPDFTDSKQTSKTHITRKSAQLLTRMDTYEVNEHTQEVFVVDDYGMHVLFDVSLEDMAHLDTELLRIGTFYLHQTH